MRQQLWQGDDISDRLEAGGGPLAGTQRLILLGPFDSGTNLMAALLRKNFPSYATEHCDSYIWKHGLDTEVSFHEVLQRLGFRPKDVYVVAMVRSPLAQLESWRHNPYMLKECLRPWKPSSKRCAKDMQCLRPWKHANRSCAADVAWRDAGLHSCRLPEYASTHRCPRGRAQFSSAIDIYNQYLRLYQSLRANATLGGVALTAYEDLVLSPEAALGALAEALGWRPPAAIDVDIMEACQKKNKGVGRARALERLGARAFLRAFPGPDRQTACRGLDRDAVRDLVEGRFVGTPRPYLQDCAGVAP